MCTDINAENISYYAIVTCIRVCRSLHDYMHARYMRIDHMHMHVCTHLMLSSDPQLGTVHVSESLHLLYVATHVAYP